MTAQGLKIDIVTSDKKDEAADEYQDGFEKFKEPIDAEQAKEKLLRGQIDLVITVNKLGRGRDFQGLRAAIRYYPSQSPAKVIQGAGRPMRVLTDTYKSKMRTELKQYTSLSDEEIEQITHKDSSNTFLIGPSRW